MCYQESRWHAICNHTIQAKVECPKQCSKYGAIDSVETQLAAYCHACRRHVDSLGLAAVHRNSSSSSSLSSMNRLSRRRSTTTKRISTAAPAPGATTRLGTSTSVENLYAAARSPISITGPSSLSRASSLRSPMSSSRGSPPLAMGGKRLAPMASTGDLRGEMMGMRGRKASMGAIMSEFVQEQEQQQREPVLERGGEDVKVFMSVSDALPDLKSPVPQKPVLSLHIPEEAGSSFPSPTPLTANTTAGDSTHSSQATRSPSAAEAAKFPKLVRPASTAPTTPKTPSSISASLAEERPSKPPRDPLPSLPQLSPQAATAPSSGGFGASLIDLRKGLRKTKSSRLLGGARLPYFLQQHNKNGPVDSPLTTAAPSLPSPTSLLRRSKSSRTLGSDDTSVLTRSSSTRSEDRVGAGAPLSPPPPPTPSSILDRPRPVAPAGTPFRAASTGKKGLIDIHDPGWLGKHGLKWDVHGLGIVSAAV